jgi:glycine cleavage system aminomethyltransferase T
MVGISVGRGVSVYYRRMISLAFIDPKYAEIGRELTVVWGTVGNPQKEIRAKVARFPYFDEDRNNEVDVAEK